jgi:hypothetical protein
MRISKRVVELTLVAAAIAAVPALAIASETINYSYDAKGRLTRVERSGTINNNVKAVYTHDKVDNRTNVNVSGSANPPP